MIIALGISEQDNFHRSEIPLEKTREIDNEARISKKAEMKRKLNRSQKRITLWDIQLSSLTSLVRDKSFFIFKDKLHKILLSALAYQYKCGGCNATFYGKTKHHFEVRICEHLGISPLTGKRVKIDKNKLTAIQECLLCCNYSPSIEEFSILTRESSDSKLKIMESLLIARDKLILNKADPPLLLELF